MVSKLGISSLLLVSSLASLSLAQQQQQQTTVLTLPFYGYDTFPISASVVAVDRSATTLILACATPTGSGDEEDEEEDECGLFPSQRMVVGPSTYHMDMSLPAYTASSPEDGEGAFTGTQDCVSQTVCVESAGGDGANFPGASTTTYESGDVERMPVTVTAGVEKLSAGAMATTTGVGSTGTARETGSLMTLTGASGMSTASEGSEGSAGSTATSTALATAADGSTDVEGRAARGNAEGLGLLAAIVGFMGVLV